MTAEELLQEESPEEVFGENAFKVYKELMLEHHPDKGGSTEVAAHINQLWQLARIRIKAGVYGTEKRAPDETFTIASKRMRYVVPFEVADKDDVCNFYEAQATDLPVEPVTLKVARSSKDNDLLANEAKIVKRVLSNKDTYNAVHPHMLDYIETFAYKTKGKKPHQVIVYQTIPNVSLYTLHQVQKAYRPALDPRHIAWIFRRLLFALTQVHRNEVVHGALLPHNVLIQPENHGVVLTNWFHSVQEGDQIRSIPKGTKHWYPKEVKEDKKPVDGKTDVYMAAQLMLMLGASHHPRLTAFMRGCMFERARMRPTAEETLTEFTELIDEMWPRKWIPFHMP